MREMNIPVEKWANLQVIDVHIQINEKQWSFIF